MSISERIKKIIDYYGISVRSFEKSIEASNNSIQTMIKRKSDVKSNTINKILQVYTDIDPIWLLTGKGNMIKKASSGADEAGSADKMTENLQYIIDLQKEKIAHLEKELAAAKRMTRKASADH